MTDLDDYPVWMEDLRDALRDDAFDSQCPLTNRAGERCTNTHHDGPCTWETT